MMCQRLDGDGYTPRFIFLFRTNLSNPVTELLFLFFAEIAEKHHAHQPAYVA